MKKYFLIIILLLLPLTTLAFSFNRSLSTGSVGEDVRQLQVFLNNYSDQTKIASFGVGSPGMETNYFGNLTKQALIRFQNLNFEQILKPLNLSSGTGYFGKGSINFINDLSLKNEGSGFGGAEAATESSPFIEKISPTKGEDETKITITGKNFTEKNNTVVVSFEYNDRFNKLRSRKDGTEIKFELDTELADKFDNSLDKLSSSARKRTVKSMSNIPLALKVVNDNGESNLIIFELELE
jgi:hypothetical protein